MAEGLLGRAGALLREHSVLLAVATVVVALLLAAQFFLASVYLPMGCHGVLERPVAKFAINSTPSPDGMRVNLSHSGGDSIPADDLYVEAPGTNRSFASSNTPSVQDGSVDTNDSIVISGLPNGSHVAVVWRNRSFEYDRKCSRGPNPYRYVLAEFVVDHDRSVNGPAAAVR